MKVVIAGGGTGGHLFPGIAIAQEFRKRDSSAQILFIGTEKGIESRVIPHEGFEIKYIVSEGFKGRGVVKKIRSISKIPAGIFHAMRILNNFNPDIVIGVGGYVSGPVGIASVVLGYFTAIQEQNLVPGVTNRILGRFADIIFTSFEESGKFFNGRRVYCTGNPVRQEIAEISRPTIVASPKSQISNFKFTLLVFGGSQGAHRINLAMVEGLKFLAEIRDSLFIVHQTGERDFGLVQSAYAERGFHGEVSPFINDMADAYRRADLVICRAGATTLSELTSCGKASVLIPFPFAVNNHQTMNAMMLKEHGASEVIIEKNLNGEILADTILSLIRDRTRLLKLGRESKKMGRPYAVSEIVEHCYRLFKFKMSSWAQIDAEIT
ncbi:MAG: undecaprenyldiphospho-muramoylpentapeptide beta-N-acetylglucosaminyltransferase [Nitrospinae bacterium]|nr:undecaprenyldiphospho-muramoylpentapeptide beta-N-acetylglucosaminyltransferase [Nitrospinota bacterium]